MKLSEEQYEIIDAYLANELSAADRAAFDDEIRADADLRAEVDRQRELRLGLRAIGIERALDRARLQYQQTESAARAVAPERAVVRPLGSWRYWAAAASVVVVLGAGYYAYQQTARPATDLAYNNALPADPTSELRKAFPTGELPSSVRNQFLDALRSYQSGKYDQVIDQLATLPADKQTIHYKNYLLGLSHLANNQPAEAIPLLTKAQASPTRSLRQKADWFLALAYVKNGQKEKALPTLKQISSDRANPFHTQAQRVLQKISN
ncbi:tetratricopeptide repeat protein [Spirosoma sordidisoli]|uniref:Tetratricopeptide repeat protein n=1 Tax=Spirosoma sordidisoli TaxID=2502893 RepID=A0A4Q2USY4_9BACT|nr:tetratricopeptide repeat protein [Spirosoma sordidisoli]RYC71011.1 tetratricopeptide repeat protein [Spirosoma sordidisoli]